MTRIYEALEAEDAAGRRTGIFHAVVRSDDEGWARRLCSHNHRSKKAAERCVHRAYLQATRRPRITVEEASGLKEG